MSSGEKPPRTRHRQAAFPYSQTINRHCPVNDWKAGRNNFFAMINTS
jgi:hypothetical protein